MERICYNPRLRDSDDLSVNITAIIMLWKLSWWPDEPTRNVEDQESAHYSL